MRFRKEFPVLGTILVIVILLAANVFAQTAGNASSNEYIQADTSNYSTLLEKVRADGVEFQRKSPLSSKRIPQLVPK